MKKLLGIILVLTLTVALAACGGGKDKEKTTTVGVSPVPHAEILEKARPLLKKKGHNLKIKPVSDYTTPNKLLDKGEIDANFFQRTPYSNTESKEKGYKTESAGSVELEPMVIYSKKYKSLKGLPKGAAVYVSNSPAEQGRFLKFSVDEGLIKLKEGVKIENVKFDDITENKKNIRSNNKQSTGYLLKIYQNQGADAVIISSNYAIDQKLSPKKDSIALEPPKDNPCANLTTVKKGHKDDKNIKVLVGVLQPKEIQDYIKDKYDGAVVPAR